MPSTPLPTEIPDDPDAIQDPSGARFASDPADVVFLEPTQPYVPNDPFAVTAPDDYADEY